MILIGYSISNKELRPVKSACVWGHFEPNVASPLIYLRRPKWITSDEDWQRIVDSVRIQLPGGTVIK